MARRRNKNRLPQVGRRVAGEVRLSPKLRRRLRRRADRSASRAFNPEIRALQREKQGLAKRRRRAVQGARGTVNFTQRALSQVSTGGLKGRYKQEVKQEVAASQRDVAASFPAIKAESLAPIREERADLRSDILDARISKKQEAADTYESLLSEVRTDAEQHIQRRQAAARRKAERKRDRRQDKKDKREDRRKAHKERQAELSLAIKEGQRLMKAKPDLVSKLDAGKKPEQLWAQLEDAIAAGEDIGPGAARRAVEIIRKYRLHQTSAFRER